MEKLRITVIILGSVLKMVRRPSKAFAEWAIHSLDSLGKPSYGSATVLLKQSLVVSLLSVGPTMARPRNTRPQNMRPKNKRPKNKRKRRLVFWGACVL